MRVPLAGALGLCLAMLFSWNLLGASGSLEHVDDVVMLDQLANLYEPVPFDHKNHAEMVGMWDGCVTCHHYQPAAADGQTMPPNTPGQNATVTVPACKSCHPLEVEKGTIELPSLKGAYHRQCLNCHRDWTGANACGACHAAVHATTQTVPPPSVDDITGRMHKPIPAPDELKIVARYTPVAGANVLFRHQAHIEDFGITCASCHRHDSCSNCHSEDAKVSALPQKGSRLMGAGATWRDVHEPCASCHAKDNCTRCHYSDGQTPPPAFDHATTGQVLDKAHTDIACGKCHVKLKTGQPPTCGGEGCHGGHMAFPAHRPGPIQTAGTANEVKEAVVAPAVAPATRPVVIRVRRGGL